MPIQVKCINAECAKSLRVNDELAGKTVRCPACKTPVKVAGAAAPAMAAAAPKAVAQPSAPPPPPAKKPTPVPAKTSPKQPPPSEADIRTLEDFADPPPAKSKVADKPSPKNGGKQDDFDEFDTLTDEAPKKGKSKKDDPDEIDTFTDEPPKKGKAKKDDPDAPKKGKRDDDYDDDYDEPKKGKKGKGKKRNELDDLPDTLWEDCDLFRHERLSTKCKFSLWKTKFSILNPDTEEEVGLAEENLPTWKGWLRMFRLGPIKFANWLTVDMEIREDAKGPVLFYIRKLATPMPWQLTSKLEILDFRKRRIGYFKTKLFSLMGGFWLYDDDDKQVAELKGKFSFTKPRMDFLDVDGEHLGDICMSIVDDKKKKKGFKIVWGNIPMVMTMNEDIRDHIPTRILFLAATMATQIAQSASNATIG